MDENYIATLYYKLKENDADIAIGNYFRFDMTDNMYYIHVHEYYERIWTRDELIEALPLLGKSDFAYEILCGKLFKRKVLDNLYFPIGQLHEDTATTFKTYLKASKIIYLHQNLYVYRRRSKSITENLTEKNYEDSFKAFEERIITLLLAGYDITSYLEEYRYKLRTTVEGLSRNEKMKDSNILKRLRMLESFEK